MNVEKRKTKLTSEKWTVEKRKNEKQTNFWNWMSKNEKQTNFWKMNVEKRKTN